METPPSESKLRAWWAHRQGLDGSLAGQSAAQVLASAGWARSIGGAAPYLTLFSRAGLRRAEVDAARNLGPEGVKKGITTTLPVALGLLQAAGEIRRVPMNGRLDQQRYKYAKWKCTQSGTFTDLARRYFAWIGPAPVQAFQVFAG